MTKRLRLFAALLICWAGLTFVAPLNAQEPANNPEGAQTVERGQDPWLWWKLANLVILVGLLGYLIKKRGRGFFDRRTEQIQSAIQDADKARREADQRVAEMERRIAGLGDEIERMRTTMRQEMAAAGKRIPTHTTPPTN